MTSDISQGVAIVRNRKSKFFVYTALLMLAVAGLGFGKSFYLRPSFSDSPLPTYLVVHGLIMSAWFVFYLAQASLVLAGRAHLHRRLGMVGVALAIGVIVTGVVVNLNLVPRMHASGLITGPDALHQGAAFALGSIAGLIIFAVMIAFALSLRHRPAAHKRLMFWSSVLLLGPAFSNARPLGRFLDSLVSPYLPFFPADFLWLFALIAYDWLTLRRVHPATYIPFIALAVSLVLLNVLIAQNAPLQQWFLEIVQNH